MITVTSCEKAKEVDGKNGKVAIYKVGLSDGRFGESFANQIPTGTSADDLQIEETQWGLKFKKKAAVNGFSGGGGKKSTNESFALSYSKDLVCAMLPKMEKQPTSGELAKVVTTIAETFFNWLEGHKK